MVDNFVSIRKCPVKTVLAQFSTILLFVNIVRVWIRLEMVWNWHHC